MHSVKLGEQNPYPATYSASCLEPIPRHLARESIDLKGVLPFTGKDIWTAFEVSWLDPDGKPVVAMATFIFDCDSMNIVESKSFKYYLNSFNQSHFESFEQVSHTMQVDLSKACGGSVEVKLCSLDASFDYIEVGRPTGFCVDHLTLSVIEYSPNATLLNVDMSKQEVDCEMYSHLLKSNCPVTNQPDWATIWIKYTGNAIKPESLLSYIISFRQHQGFHENCVERIFSDITKVCRPEKLSVYARYTRRGGLDINPFRTNANEMAPLWRIARQ